MKNITYISAGAGSGKTYRLVHILADLFENDPSLRPEQVIMTTYTRKAAAELLNKARELLCERGKYEIAASLDRALTGTVHSVGYDLLTRFWYYCGLPAKMNVLSREAMSAYIASSISEVATEEDLEFFSGIIAEFDIKNQPYGENPFDWQNNLSKLIESAHNFGITDFSESLVQSLNLIDKAYHFEPAVQNPSEIKDEALAALLELSVICGDITDKRSIEKAARIQKRIPLLADSLRRRGDRIATYFQLGSFLDTETKSGKFNTDNIATIREKLSMLRYCPEAVARVKEYVSRLFDLADRWRTHYLDFKKARGVLDFNDIEHYTLKLLRRDDVLAEIRTEYRYLLVDEFQDSNSVQIEIFSRLSEQMAHSWWVGDAKQSIYGFRGANTALVQKVAADIHDGEDGCSRDVLDTSRRSVPALVEFANNIFTRVFEGMTDVALKPHKDSIPEVKPLTAIRIAGKNNTEKADKLAEYVNALIHDESHRRYADNLDNFAVLTRSGAEAGRIAASLRKLGVPVSISAELKESREYQLLKAVLTLCSRGDNNLARAQVAYLTTQEYGLEAIIESKIDFDSMESEENWLDDVEIVKSLVEFSKSSRHLGVADYVQSAITLLGLERYSYLWPDGNALLWKELASAASAYESRCIALGLPATLNGFIASGMEQNEDSDAPKGVRNAVQVMTYHKSKGLQWPVTILTSLERRHTSEGEILDKGITGVSVHESDANYITLFPRVAASAAPDAVMTNLRECGEIKRQMDKTLAEEARLLYVGVTRAADQLVLVTCGDGFDWFDEMGADALPMPVDYDGVVSTGSDGLLADRDMPYVPAASDFRKKEARNISPSQVRRAGKAEKVALIGERVVGIKARSDDEMANVGNCIHQIYCCIEGRDGESLCRSLMSQYGIDYMESQAGTIVSNWNALVDYLEKTYGPSTARRHETPFKYSEGGQHVTGDIDFIWETAEGAVIVDYKTFAGSMESALAEDGAHYAGNYKGQLDCYRKAVEMAGHKVIDTLIFYPSIGLIVKVF